MSINIKDKAHKVVVTRNRLGSIVGVKLDGKKVELVTDVKMKASKTGLPRVTITIITPNIEFEDLDTYSANGGQG